MSLELREPPRPSSSPTAGGAVRWLLVVNLALVAAVGALVWLRTGPHAAAAAGNAAAARQVAAKLQTAGALDEAAALYGDYLADAAEPAEARAKIAYTLGADYLEAGQYEKALRWFYEADTLGAGPLHDELDRKIVTTLERLGRPRAAQAALAARVRLDRPDDAQHAADDPVVAKIGEREIHRSEVDRALDDMPPEMARAFSGGSPADLLRRYVADELMYRKAQKLGYDRDPDVVRRREALGKQLAVARFLDREVVGKISADDVDLQSYFTAHRDRYQQAADNGGKGKGKEVTFEQARPMVERDYRLAKAQEAYQKLIDSELSGGDVQLFAEKMGGEGAAGGGKPAPAPPAGTAPPQPRASAPSPAPAATTEGGSR